MKQYSSSFLEPRPGVVVRWQDYRVCLLAAVSHSISPALLPAVIHQSPEACYCQNLKQNSAATGMELIND